MIVEYNIFENLFFCYFFGIFSLLAYLSLTLNTAAGSSVTSAND